MSQPVVTIAGSYRKHLDRLLTSKDVFEAAGAKVLRPRSDAAVDEPHEATDFVRLEGDPDDATLARRQMYVSIDEAAEAGGLLYVVNPAGYVGPSAIANVAWAARAGVTIVLQEPAYEADVADLADGVGDEAYALRLLESRQAH